MRRKLGEILLSSGAVSPADIAGALSDQSAGEPSRLGDLLVAQGKLTPTQLAQALAEQYGVPYTTLPPLATAVLEAVPLEFQRRHRLVPIRVEGTALSIAMADLANSDALAWLQKNWPQVKVFAAAGDEIDALHSALSGELPLARPSPFEGGASAEELFGALDLEVTEDAAAAPEATESALFGDLNLDGAEAPPAASPSGMFELQVEEPAGAVAGFSGQFELKVEEPAEGEVLDLTTEAELPPDGAGASPAANTADDGEDELFFEAKVAAPSPEPIAPPPVVAPLSTSSPVSAPAPAAASGRHAAVAVPTVAAGASGKLPPVDSAAKGATGKQPAVSPGSSGATGKHPAAPAARGATGKHPPVDTPASGATGKPAPVQATGATGKHPPASTGATGKHAPVAADASAAPLAVAGPGIDELIAALPQGEPVPPLRDDTYVPRGQSVLEQLFVEPEHPAREAKPADKPLPKAAEKKVGGLELPDWLQGDAAPAQTLTEETAVDPWTGELETLAPSKLITGVARALIRKGILTEEDVLEALERKKP